MQYNVLAPASAAVNMVCLEVSPQECFPAFPIRGFALKHINSNLFFILMLIGLPLLIDFWGKKKKKEKKKRNSMRDNPHVSCRLTSTQCISFLKFTSRSQYLILGPYPLHRVRSGRCGTPMHRGRHRWWTAPVPGAPGSHPEDGNTRL